MLLLQSLLIAWLLYERRARRRAEIDSRQNLSLAADANRRGTMSALASSIGHELGQPLSAIRYNAQALQMMVTANQAAPDETGEILADIQAEAILATQIIDRHRTLLRSHQLHKKPIDLRSVIDESLALVAHDMRGRQVEVTLDLSSTPCVVDGDQVLLVQVLVNLLRNAVDALAAMPAARRHVTIRSAVTAAGVEVSVSDTGAGLPAEIIATLFTPFVTTKSHGLGVGLAIAQRIVDAHGGTIGAHENPGGGATFTVTLPRSAPGRCCRVTRAEQKRVKHAAQAQSANAGSFRPGADGREQPSPPVRQARLTESCLSDPFAISIGVYFLVGPGHLGLDGARFLQTIGRHVIPCPCARWQPLNANVRCRE